MFTEARQHLHKKNSSKKYRRSLKVKDKAIRHERADPIATVPQ